MLKLLGLFCRTSPDVTCTVLFYETVDQRVIAAVGHISTTLMQKGGKRQISDMFFIVDIDAGHRALSSPPS